MLTQTDLRSQIQAAATALHEALASHPECDACIAEPFIRRNALRPYPLMNISPAFPDIPEALRQLSARAPADLCVEEQILQSLLSSATPIQMRNPTQPVLFLGRGPGTLAASFGIRLDEKIGYTPSGTRALEEVLAEGMPDVERSGIIPQMRRHIEAIQMLTPPWVQIAPPDTQGPFNIAHMVLGNDAFLMPLLEPELFDEFMTMVTDFYIAFYKALRGWIGEDRYTKTANSRCRLRECSVNLISADMYLEHVLKHDVRIAEFFGEVCMHPCSGRHVFMVTQRNLPHIVYQEAMPFHNSIAPSVGIDEAIAEVGDKPISLHISRDLTMANAEDVIRADFEINRLHPAFLFQYSIQDAQRADKDAIVQMHERLNAHWHEEIYR